MIDWILNHLDNIWQWGSLMGSGFWFLWRVCLRFDRLEQRLTMQDEQREELRADIRELRAVLMSRGR